MEAPLLQALLEQMDPLEDVCAELSRAIVENPPAILREGGLIANGYDEELDRLRAIQNGGGDLLEQLEVREREATGIRNLRVRSNRVYGYYIEIPKSYTGPVPEHYVRKQTTSTAERYFTPELKELESSDAHRQGKNCHTGIRPLPEAAAAGAGAVAAHSGHGLVRGRRWTR